MILDKREAIVTWIYEDGKKIEMTWNQMLNKVTKGIPLFIAFENKKILSRIPTITLID